MKDYIGDGVYVEFDGFGLKLWTQREGGEHWIYLEPSVYHALLAFVERIKEVDRNEQEQSI